MQACTLPQRRATHDHSKHSKCSTAQQDMTHPSTAPTCSPELHPECLLPLCHPQQLRQQALSNWLAQAGAGSTAQQQLVLTEHLRK